MPNKAYVPWFTDDFLGGIVDLEAEEIGIYTVILTLMASHDAPITDDPQWIARRSGSTTRRVNKVLNRLAGLGKIERKNGLIGNKKMLEVIRKRAGKSKMATKAANAKWAKWREKNEPQLPFVENDNQENGQKNARKTPTFSPEKTEIKSPVKMEKSQNSAKNPVQTHNSLRAREYTSNISNNQSNESLKTPRAKSDASKKDDDRMIDSDKDLAQLFETVSATAGYVPRGANGYAEGFELVKQWRDLGINFDTTVIPEIENIVAKSDDPTSSLRRFDRTIRAKHAKKRAQAKLPPNAKAKVLPPIERKDDDHQQVALLRKWFDRDLNFYSLRVSLGTDGHYLFAYFRSGAEKTSFNQSEHRFILSDMARAAGFLDCKLKIHESEKS